MPAARYDVQIEQGATFALDLTYTDAAGDPVDLTGWEAHAQFRPDYTEAPILSITHDDYIEQGDDDGTVEVRVPASVTEDLPSPVAGVYDLTLTNVSTGFVIRLVAGLYTVSPAVTREA